MKLGDDASIDEHLMWLRQAVTDPGANLRLILEGILDVLEARSVQFAALVFRTDARIDELAALVVAADQRIAELADLLKVKKK